MKNKILVMAAIAAFSFQANSAVKLTKYERLMNKIDRLESSVDTLTNMVRIMQNNQTKDLSSADNFSSCRSICQDKQEKMSSQYENKGEIPKAEWDRSFECFKACDKDATPLLKAISGMGC